MWKGTIFDETLDRSSTISVTCCEEILNHPAVTNRTVKAKKQKLFVWRGMQGWRNL